MNYIIYPLAFVGIFVACSVIAAVILGRDSDDEFPDDY